MKHPTKYTLDYAREVYEHLDFIERKYHRLIANTIKQQLSHRPDHPTRNRKPLEEPVSFGATWELRFGPHNSFRVFYEVDNSNYVVTILAVGVKTGNRVFIGGEEFES
jgi:mRNA-degrading endonuclease RelE of RelBE toxin-antitoxin system